VSDKEGVTEMTLYPTTNTGASTMSNSFNFKTKFQFIRKIFLGKQKVYLKTIDQLLNGLGSVKLAKIDIEGFEMLALHGAKETLRTKRIINILLEVHPVALESMNFSVEGIISYLRDYGYKEALVSPNLYLFTFEG
jgi:FkbM family methyltransferase